MRRKIDKEKFYNEIEVFMQFDIHVPTKTLYMGSQGEDWDGYENGTDFSMAERVIKGLTILDEIRPEEPINIIMNNPGGCWYSGMAIYDAIKNCQSSVHITARGHVMSMGSIIFQAADFRIMSPNTKMMIHDGSSGTGGHSKNVIAWADEEKSILQDMYRIYHEKMKNCNRKQLPKKVKDRFTEFGWSIEGKEGISLFEIKQLCTVDLILNAKEAKLLKLADMVEGEDEDMNE